MESDVRALVSLAQAYFDAAHEMDADAFASLFHPSSAVTAATRVGDDLTVTVTPIEAWLATVRTMQAPRQLGLARRDELVAVDVVGELAVVKLKLQIPPRDFTDVLSCARIDDAWKIVQKVTQVDSRSSR
jgi:hypothetical protein